MLVPRLTAALVVWWQEQGARGVIDAQVSGAEVTEAVRLLVRHGVYVADASHLVGAREGRADGLTPRERQAVTLLARDLAPKQIAARMGITPGTASVLLSAAKRKLGVQTNAGLALHAVREGWATLHGPDDGPDDGPGPAGPEPDDPGPDSTERP